MDAPQEINLVVPEPAPLIPVSTRWLDAPDDNLVASMISWPGHDNKPIALDKLRSGLDDIQGQIDGLLERVNEPKSPSFRLKSVDVSLAITAEGSIGIASAGVQASMTLSFERTSSK